MQKYKSISLFSCAGIGDFGFKKAGIQHIVMNELLEDRANIAMLNFPESDFVVGDIRELIDVVESKCREQLDIDEELFLLSATPPCQGMSKNGIGSILKAMREGKRPKIDERNYLFKPALELIERLKPKYFFWENVDRMEKMYVVDEDENEVLLTEYIEKFLITKGYIGQFKIVNFADYGVPQNRRRMVGIFRKISENSKENFTADMLFPKPTTSNYRTLRSVIEDLPSLDSKDKSLAVSSFHPLHKVPVSRKELYWWIENTSEGDTAYNNNKCIECGMINIKEDVYCVRCNSLLPKPTVEKDNDRRLIRGFISAYKRMKYDEPAPTITTRSAYACSDNNIHPTQNRVLSIYEIALLHGLTPTEYKWGPITKIDKNGKKTIKTIASDTLLRDILGEPVSPIFTEIVGKHLIAIDKEIAE